MPSSARLIALTTLALSRALIFDWKNLMAPVFSDLLKRPSGEGKRPSALPVGSYPGIVRKWESGEGLPYDKGDVKTPFVRFFLGFTGTPEDADPADFEGIDVSKRQVRKEFELTDERIYQLDEFIASCGVSLGRAYEEILPEVVGAPVLVEMKQRMGKDNEIYDQVGKVTGTANA
jgi:hypothetical protein